MSLSLLQSTRMRRRSSRSVVPHFGEDPGMRERGLAAIVREAGQALAVEPGPKAFGCGQYGCVVPTTDGRVLKITVDQAEVRWVFAASAAHESRGFVRIEARPVRLWPLEHAGHAYAYLRERVAPLRARDLGKRADRLFLELQDLTSPPPEAYAVQWSHAMSPSLTEMRWAEDQRRPEYLAIVAKLAGIVPAVAASLTALAEQGHLTFDVHPGNMGRRADGTVVLFDGRVNPTALQTVARPVAEDLTYLDWKLAREATQTEWEREHGVTALVQELGLGGATRRRLRFPCTDAEWEEVWALAAEVREHPEAMFPAGRRENPARTLRSLGPSHASRVLELHESWDDRGEGMLQAIVGERKPGCAGRGKGSPRRFVTLATVTAVKYIGDDQAFYVRRSEAEPGGWGPLAYDLVMERATELGYGLAPDPRSVTESARRVWDTYLTRPDVWTTERAPRQNVTWIGATGKHTGWPPSDVVFHKEPTSLERLRRDRPTWYTERRLGEEARVRTRTHGPRLANPVMLAGIASLFAMMPITPIVALGAATKAKRSRNHAR